MTAIILAFSFIAGVLLGAAYFASLWSVLQRLSGTERPALLLAGTGILRVAVLLGGLALISAGEWERLLSALGGFVVVRFIALRWVRRTPGRHSRPA